MEFTPSGGDISDGDRIYFTKNCNDLPTKNAAQLSAIPSIKRVLGKFEPIEFYNPDWDSNNKGTFRFCYAPNYASNYAANGVYL